MDKKLVCALCEQEIEEGKEWRLDQPVPREFCSPDCRTVWSEDNLGHPQMTLAQKEADYLASSFLEPLGAPRRVVEILSDMLRKVFTSGYERGYTDGEQSGSQREKLLGKA